MDPAAVNDRRRTDGTRTVLAGVLALVLVPAAATAAPTEDDGAEDDAAEDEAELSARQQAEQLARARELFAAGQARFDTNDHAGAIEAWQEAYDILPLCQRSQLFAPLASAYWAAYPADHDVQHLQRAKEMYTRHLEALGTLGANFEQARIETEAQLAEIEAEFERLEAERLEAERERATAAAIAAERERQRELEQAELAARTERDRRRFRLSMILGGSAAGLGVASLGVMTAGLALGASVERRGDDLADAPNPRPVDLRTLLYRGNAYNRMALATGLVGGALVVSGGTIVVLGLVQRQRARADAARARLRPGVGGLEVRF